MPKSILLSALAIVSAMLVTAAVFTAFKHAGDSLGVAILALALGTYCSDALSAVVHFCFDYVIPDRFPILGGVAKSFRDHHDNPILDPGTRPENYAIGATSAAPLAVLSLTSEYFSQGGQSSHLASMCLAVMAVWGMFFHQIHAYAHMGSSVDVAHYGARIDQIVLQHSSRDRRRMLNEMFDGMPIPSFVRALQRLGILLDPVRHVSHHREIDCNFSSVNGWSDALLNPLMRQLVRRFYVTPNFNDSH